MGPGFESLIAYKKKEVFWTSYFCFSTIIDNIPSGIPFFTQVKTIWGERVLEREQPEAAFFALAK